MLLLKFAYRNLARNTKRTCLAALAMTTGLTISFWLDCTLSGRNSEVVKFVTSSFIGTLQIYDKDFLEEKSVTKTTDFDLSVLEEKFPKELSVTSRIYLPSLISSGESSYPVIAQGILPSKEKNVSTVLQSIKQGEVITENSACSPGEVLISDRLSRMLKVGLGEKIVLLTQAADGSLGNDLFRVKGLYDTGSGNFDKGLIFITHECAKQLGAVSKPHEIVMALKSGVDQDLIMKMIRPFIGEKDVLTTWEDAVPAVARMIKVNNAIMGMVSFIVLVVVILGFVNTLLMSVFERTKEIGMMLSVGFSPNQVRLLLVYESLIIGLLSSFLAIVFGSLLVLYHQKVGFDLRPFVGKSFDANIFSFSLVIYPVFSWVSFIKVILLSLGIVILSVLFPAYKASRLSPLEVLRG